MKSIYDFPTPALLIDQSILLDNCRRMQEKADRLGVSLRPHTKTHKSPVIAKLQQSLGCHGITVAKLAEAETMADAGMDDIFIANELIGRDKYLRARALHERIRLSIGLDSLAALAQIEQVFAGTPAPLGVLIEIEVGEQRSGIVTEEEFLVLLESIRRSNAVELIGIFSHEGHTYEAKNVEQCLALFQVAQARTLSFANMAKAQGFPLRRVSVGATPSLLHCAELLPGITEIRPGTYALMDCKQSNAIGTYAHCAATILTSVTSKPTHDRLITDAGAKALTMQGGGAGLCRVEGYGRVKGTEERMHGMFDEHGIFYSKPMWNALQIGDKIEIIPNHICPVCNLYDEALLVSGGQLVERLPISCRGKLT